MQTQAATPVLEIGGTHVTAALVDQHDGGWTVRESSLLRRPLDAHESAEVILDVVARAGRLLGDSHDTRWGVALPGPFDYESGIGRYEDVGKFEALNGIDVGARLASKLGPLAATITFLNDADAFGIGEYALRHPANMRLACITLGTGVGSAFLLDGIPAKAGPAVPPDGACHLIEYRGRALEDTVSRRAIRRRYAELTTDSDDRPRLLDVHEIAELSRQGDGVAAQVLHQAFTSLGEAIAPYLQDFEAETLVIGGSMAGSWDIVHPAIRRGLMSVRPQLEQLPVVRSGRFEQACLVGTARWVRSNPTC